MAYMNQEKKAVINAKLKNIIPKTWKWTLAVRDYSTIMLNIKSAPVDLMGVYNANTEYKRNYAQAHSACNFESDAAIFELMTKIFSALNTDNFDHSDSQTDYFHVGHYVRVNVGQYDQPFKYVEAA